MDQPPPPAALQGGDDSGVTPPPPALIAAASASVSDSPPPPAPSVPQSHHPAMRHISIASNNTPPYSEPPSAAPSAPPSAPPSPKHQTNGTSARHSLTTSASTIVSPPSATVPSAIGTATTTTAVASRSVTPSPSPMPPSTSTSFTSPPTLNITPSPAPVPSASAPTKKPAKPTPTVVPGRLPHRVADYFLVVGGVRQATDSKDGDSALLGAQQSQATNSLPSHPQRLSITSHRLSTVRKPKIWSARVLDRFPRVDHPDAEFPRDLEMFCFPSAYELSPLCHTPEAHCFVLTEADGTRVYGCALRFWEALDEQRLSRIEYGLIHGFENTVSSPPSSSPTTHLSTDILGQLVYAPKSFVIISHWPFFSQFERFLSSLHKHLYITSDSNMAPIERVLTNFIFEIPLPPQGKCEVECRSFLNPFSPWTSSSCPWSVGSTFTTNSLLNGKDSHSSNSSHNHKDHHHGANSADKRPNQPFLFSRPPPNKAPLRDFSLSALFRWLSLENIFLLYSAVLTERRILFVSDKLYKLTIAAESITYLLYPFYWRHIYIPLLPARLTDFICAPMPYIVGIQRCNMPDELMLDSVVIVDLDQNLFTNSSGANTESSNIPSLPPDRLSSLQRHLKKLVIDPTTPIKPNQYIQDHDIEIAFLKCHVRLFAHYRDYLEAPSEIIIDKFQKARFCAEHEEKGGLNFLTEFMETQMFQCFIDDRYDQSTRALTSKGAVAANFEVLFFDENIDLSLGKPAPFLSDSSQNIVTSARVIAFSPNLDGLTRGAIYKYQCIPMPLDTSLFGTPREITDLAGADSSRGGSGGTSGSNAGGTRKRFGMDMEAVSYKFFQEKRLYSQHFHTLRLRSAKQDTAFKNIVAYFRAEQSMDETGIHELERLTTTTVDRDTPDTGTTLDPAWLRLRRSVQEELAAELESFRSIRDDCAGPLYVCCSEREHQLKMLFAEANTIETRAAKGKSAVERAKSSSIAAFQRYESLKEQMRDRILTASEVSRIVTAQSDSEDYRLNLDESETYFHTIVEEYEKRMPQIIATIRQLNKERIMQLRISLTKWIEIRRTQLQSQLAQLERVDAAVQNIDAEKDLVSFSEGTNDFWRAAATAAVSGASVTQKPAGASSPTNASAAAAAASATANAAASVTSPPSTSITISVDPLKMTSPPTASSLSSSTSNSSTQPLIVETMTPQDMTESGILPDHMMLSVPPPLVTASPSATPDPAASNGNAGGQFVSPPPVTAPSASPVSSAGTASSVGVTPAVSASATPASSPMKRISISHAIHNKSTRALTTVTSPTSHSSSLIPSSESLRTMLCYPLNLWGGDGFERAATQATLTRKILKEFIVCMTGWIETTDVKSKKLTNMLRILPEFRESQLTSGEKNLWEALKQRTLFTSRAYAEFMLVLLKIVSDLSLIRGELKFSVARFRDHRLKLEKEVSVSHEYLAKALEKKERTARAVTVAKNAQLMAVPTPASAAGSGASSSTNGTSTPSLSSSSLLSPPLNSRTIHSSQSSPSQFFTTDPAAMINQLQATYEAAFKTAKEAAHEHTLQVRNNLAVQRKHDICISRLLRLFEKKERFCLTEMKKALSTLAEQFHSLLIQSYRRGDEALVQAVRNINIQSEMREFVENATGTKITPGEKIEFGKHLGPSGYNAASGLLQVHILHIRLTYSFLEELSSTDDMELKVMKKTLNRVRSCRPTSTLHSAAMAFESLLDRLAEITEDNVRIVHDAAQPFNKLKSTLKSHAKQHEARMTDVEKTYRKSLDEKDRAAANEKACEDLLKLAHIKTEQGKDDAGSSSSSSSSSSSGKLGGLFSSFMSTPLRDLQAKEASALKDLEKARLVTQEKEAALVVATNKRTSDVIKLLTDMQETDMKRWNSQGELILSVCTKHTLHVDKMQTLLHNFSNKVAEIHVDSDMHDFLVKNATSSAPTPDGKPQSVLASSPTSPGAGGAGGGNVFPSITSPTSTPVHHTPHTLKPPDYVVDDYRKYIDAVALQMAESMKVGSITNKPTSASASSPTHAQIAALGQSGHSSSISSNNSTSSTSVPARVKIPGTHHGYSNSTSLINVRPISQVNCSVPAPPPMTAMFATGGITSSAAVGFGPNSAGAGEFSSPTRTRGGTAMPKIGTVPTRELNAAIAAQQAHHHHHSNAVNHMPTASSSAVAVPTLTTAASSSSGSSSPLKPLQIARQNSMQSMSSIGSAPLQEDSIEEEMDELLAASDATTTTTVKIEAIPPTATSNAAQTDVDQSHVHEFSSSDGDLPPIQPIVQQPEEAEFQDENGDWIRRHDNTVSSSSPESSLTLARQTSQTSLGGPIGVSSGGGTGPSGSGRSTPTMTTTTAATTNGTTAPQQQHQLVSASSSNDSVTPDPSGLPQTTVTSTGGDIIGIAAATFRTPSTRGLDDLSSSGDEHLTIHSSAHSHSGPHLDSNSNPLTPTPSPQAIGSTRPRASTIKSATRSPLPLPYPVAVNRVASPAPRVGGGLAAPYPTPALGGTSRSPPTTRGPSPLPIAANPLKSSTSSSAATAISTPGAQSKSIMSVGMSGMTLAKPMPKTAGSGLAVGAAAVVVGSAATSSSSPASPIGSSSPSPAPIKDTIASPPLTVSPPLEPVLPASHLSTASSTPSTTATTSASASVSISPNDSPAPSLAKQESLASAHDAIAVTTPPTSAQMPSLERAVSELPPPAPPLSDRVDSELSTSLAHAAPSSSSSTNSPPPAPFDNSKHASDADLIPQLDSFVNEHAHQSEGDEEDDDDEDEEISPPASNEPPVLPPYSPRSMATLIPTDNASPASKAVE